jgi:gliding motility-associated lipoprotein GldD
MKRIFLRVLPAFFIILLALYSSSCRKHFTPKPRGFFRIDLPERNYLTYNSSCPFLFEFPGYGNVVRDSSPGAEPCWLNIDLKPLNGRIHLSYKTINGNLGELIEDARTLAYKHTAKADAINETLVSREKDRVYCILYDIEGNAASSVQFFITDSTRHFLRGALYFESSPNADSMAPVIQFVREDIVHLLNTISWKK